MSRFHFHRVFKSVTGSDAERRTRTRIAPIACGRSSAAGRASPRRSTRPATTRTDRSMRRRPAVLGMTPRRFRAGGAGDVDPIRGGTVLARFGARRGDGEGRLRDPARRRSRRRSSATSRIGFRTRSSSAAMRRSSSSSRRPSASSRRRAPGANLPLDVRGTAFQQRVWQALRAIPAGSTATYADIARRIGAPKAVRGVAQACAANPVAVAIPCHRVVRTDGALAGYRWGIERKRVLLERNGCACAASASSGVSPEPWRRRNLSLVP